MSKARQRGYTLAELTGAIACGLLIMAVTATAAVTRLRGIRLENATDTARMIATAVDLNRRRVASSTIDPATDVYTYTYREEPNWVSVATFNTTYGTQLPTTTPWGGNYEIRSSGARIASVRFQVPYNYRAWPANANLFAINSNLYQITVWAEQRTQLRNMRNYRFRRDFLNENPR